MNRGNVSFQLRVWDTMQPSNDDNFDFIMCTNYKKLFCLFPLHLILRLCSIVNLLVLYTIDYIYTCTVIFFLPLFRSQMAYYILQLYREQSRKSGCHTDTKLLLSIMVFSISISFYLYFFHHLGRCHRVSRTIFALSSKCSFSSIHSIAYTNSYKIYTHTYEPSHIMKSIKFSLALHEAPSKYITVA